MVICIELGPKSLPWTFPWQFGATNDHRHLDETPTEIGREQLLDGLRQLLGSSVEDVEIIDHRAGVRPNTSDRRPFLGAHPQHPELLVFNGFGGRGTLTIPWHAEIFADWLEGKVELPADVDIRRLA